MEETETFQDGQMIFARVGGATVAGHVDRVDHGAHTVGVAWNLDCRTKERIEGLLRGVVCGRFNPVRTAA